MLGIRPTYWQRRILLSILRNKSTAVASCHGAGKTFTMALAALWWFCTRKPAVVITTAPTGRQVKNLLWREIRKLHAKSRRKLPGRVLSVGIEVDGEPDWYAMGFASRDSNAAQGVHSQNALIIYDEASGVEDDIHDSMEGALTDENSREVAVGNPTGTAGFFRDAFEKQSEFWNCINISALKTLNVRLKRNLIPGMVGWDWVQKIEKRFGKKSPYYICRVLGKFFTFMDEKIVPKPWIEAAQKRWDATEDGFPRILCADIAASGEDSTAVVLRAGRRLHVIDVYQEPDTMANARRILDYAKQLGAQRIHIDATGVGKGPYDRLHEMDLGELELVGVRWGTSSTEKHVFNRLLDEIWWRTRGAFDPGTPEEPNHDVAAIDPNCQYAQQLADQLNVRRWKLDNRAKIKVETKAELRARGAGSPDVGDAASLAFYEAKEIWLA